MDRVRIAPEPTRLWSVRTSPFAGTTRRFAGTCSEKATACGEGRQLESMPVVTVYEDVPRRTTSACHPTLLRNCCRRSPHLPSAPTAPSSAPGPSRCSRAPSRSRSRSSRAAPPPLVPSRSAGGFLHLPDGCSPVGRTPSGASWRASAPPRSGWAVSSRPRAWSAPTRARPTAPRRAPGATSLPPRWRRAAPRW